MLRREAILLEPILPLLLRQSLPTLIGMLVMVIYNLTDTFFIGLLHNRAMTAAIGVSFTAMSFLQAVGFLLGYGSGNALSRKLGENREGEARDYAATGLWSAVGLGLVLGLGLSLWAGPLAAFLGGGASPELLRYTTSYLRVLGWSAPFVLYSLTLYNQMRLCGNARGGMLGLLAGMLTNVVLDPVLLFGLRLGFVSVAYATFAGQVLGCVVLSVLAHQDEMLILKAGSPGTRLHRLPSLLAGGLPNFARQTITSFALLLLNRVAVPYGEGLLAALTVSSRAFAPVYLLVIGWCQGFQPVCAMNAGAGQHRRVRQAFRLTLLIGTGYLLVATVVLLAFAPDLAGLLTHNSSVRLEAARFLRWQCLSVPFLGFLALSSMYLQNTGHYFWSLSVSVARQGLFFLPLLYVLPAGLGVLGLELLQPVADLLSCELSLVILLWLFPKITPKEEQAPQHD